MDSIEKDSLLKSCVKKGEATTTGQCGGSTGSMLPSITEALADPILKGIITPPLKGGDEFLLNIKKFRGLTRRERTSVVKSAIMLAKTKDSVEQHTWTNAAAGLAVNVPRAERFSVLKELTKTINKEDSTAGQYILSNVIYAVATEKSSPDPEGYFPYNKVSDASKEITEALNPEFEPETQKKLSNALIGLTGSITKGNCVNITNSIMIALGKGLNPEVQLDLSKKVHEISTTATREDSNISCLSVLEEICRRTWMGITPEAQLKLAKAAQKLSGKIYGGHDRCKPVLTDIEGLASDSKSTPVGDILQKICKKLGFEYRSEKRAKNDPHLRLGD